MNKKTVKTITNIYEMTHFDTECQNATKVDFTILAMVVFKNICMYDLVSFCNENIVVEYFDGVVLFFVDSF